MNNNTHPTELAWPQPPHWVVVVQCILYASLETALLAAFLAMLGKQWINRYNQRDGRSAGEKSRIRQQKLDGLNKFYFHLVVGGPSAMLQFALFLLGCALSKYFWTANRPVALVSVSFMFSATALYLFFTITAISDNCPYWTPFSFLARILAKLIFSVLSFGAHSVRQGLHGAAALLKLRRVSVAQPNLELPQTTIMPAQSTTGQPIYFGENNIDLNICEGDARCVSWILDSATDDDVVICAARFAADTILYPQVADILNPHMFAHHLFRCMDNGRVIPGKLEHMSVIGRALASILSIQLCVHPTSQDLQELCSKIRIWVGSVSSSEPTFLAGITILGIALPPTNILQAPKGNFPNWDVFSGIPHNLPTKHKHSLSRTMLQTIWRWRTQNPNTVLTFNAIDVFCKRLMVNNKNVPLGIIMDCFLIIVLSLGSPVGCIDSFFSIPNTMYVILLSFCDPCSPDGSEALQMVIKFFDDQLQVSIQTGRIEQRDLAAVLSSLVHLNPFQVLGTAKPGFSWLSKILNSRYSKDERYQVAGQVVQLLENYFNSEGWRYPVKVEPNLIPPVAHFLPLYQEFYTVDSPTYPRPLIHIILSTMPSDFNKTIIPLLTLTLSPTHPLRLRSLALKTFLRLTPGWFSSQMENVPGAKLRNLLQAIDNPFEFTPDPPLHDKQPLDGVDYDPIAAAVVLMEFASSDLWKNHLQQLNFMSCENFVSTDEGRKAALKCMTATAAHTWWKFLDTRSKVDAAMRCLEVLQCPNTAQVINEWAANPR